MAEYAYFHDLRRFVANIDNGNLTDTITCHKNKDQLSKWLNSQTSRALAQDVASMHGVAFCSFEDRYEAPLSYLTELTRKACGIAIARMLNQLIMVKEQNAQAYGNAFTVERLNVHGMHQYDFDLVQDCTDNVLVSVNHNTPEDFINGFDSKLLVDSNKHTTSILALIPKHSLSIGVAVLAKSRKMIQIHCGATVKSDINVRIITNDIKHSYVDKILAMHDVFDRED